MNLLEIKEGDYLWRHKQLVHVLDVGEERVFIRNTDAHASPRELTTSPDKLTPYKDGLGNLPTFKNYEPAGEFRVPKLREAYLREGIEGKEPDIFVMFSDFGIPNVPRHIYRAKAAPSPIENGYEFSRREDGEVYFNTSDGNHTPGKAQYQIYNKWWQFVRYEYPSSPVRDTRLVRPNSTGEWEWASHIVLVRK